MGPGEHLPRLQPPPHLSGPTCPGPVGTGEAPEGPGPDAGSAALAGRVAHGRLSRPPPRPAPPVRPTRLRAGGGGGAGGLHEGAGAPSVSPPQRSLGARSAGPRLCLAACPRGCQRNQWRDRGGARSVPAAPLRCQVASPGPLLRGRPGSAPRTEPSGQLGPDSWGGNQEAVYGSRSHPPVLSDDSFWNPWQLAKLAESHGIWSPTTHVLGLHPFGPGLHGHKKYGLFL